MITSSKTSGYTCVKCGESSGQYGHTDCASSAYIHIVASPNAESRVKTLCGGWTVKFRGGPHYRNSKVVALNIGQWMQLPTSAQCFFCAKSYPMWDLITQPKTALEDYKIAIEVWLFQVADLFNTV